MDQPNAQHSFLMSRFSLSEDQFSARFEFISEIEDPYVRLYTICQDLQKKQKVAVRIYAATDSQQENDIIQNMESYRKLSQVQGMCKLIAFCKKQENGTIQAAFEYNKFSLEEAVLNNRFPGSKDQFYWLLLKQIVFVMQNAKNLGIMIEELIPSSILFDQVNGKQKIKILFDERQVRYDKIQQGLKVMASPQRIQLGIKNQQPENEENQQGIFELGLLLLDCIYQCQGSKNNQNDDMFVKDRPLKKVSISHKSYLIFDDEDHVHLNKVLIKQKFDFLSEQRSPFLDRMRKLIEKMIATTNERITLQDLVKQIEIQSHFQSKLKLKVQENIVTPTKLQNTRNQQLINISKKQQNNYSENNEIKKNVVSQTTMATTIATTTSYTPIANYPSQNLDFLLDLKIQNQILPKEKLLKFVKSNSLMLEKFQSFLSKMEVRPNIIKKQYLDKNIYYGQINGNGKRQGSGVFLYNNGDVYFGVWKDNGLVDGNFIFKNGDSFEGVVRGGKQNYGRYIYSNGNIYEGQWKDDVKCGLGKMKYPNGDIYDGMWNKGKKNGQGIYYYSNGTQYDGSFVDGKKCGFGVITFPNQTKIQAYWNKTYIEGPGKVFYSNGNYFEGNYHLSQKEGKGLYIWDDAKYEGEFMKDLMQGTARIKYSQVQFYQGQIKNGKRNGKGIYHYANGDSFSGDWKNDDKMIGLYKFRDGGSFEGRFKRNQINYGLMIYENGQSYEGQFSNGERHGLGSYCNTKKQVIYEGKWHQDEFIVKM